MIASLDLGTYSVGKDKKFVPVSRDAPLVRGTLKLGINPFLIKNESLTALIDAGLGPFGTPKYHSRIASCLEKHDLSPNDIQHVFCSHMHLDHVGGLINDRYGMPELTFPNAVIWVSGKDWKRFVDKADSSGHHEAIRWAAYLEIHADLRFVEDHPPEPEGITMTTIGGHTPFQQGIFYKNGAERAMMLGDVLARPEAINRNFTARFDFDGKKSQENRDKYLRMAFREKYLILLYHGVQNAISVLKNYDEKKGYDVEHIPSENAGIPA